MYPGVSSAVVDPRGETIAWLERGLGEVLVWMQDTPEWFMQYVPPSLCGDKVMWMLKTLDLESQDSPFEPARSRLIGQVELTEIADPMARDIGTCTGLIRSIGVVYAVDDEALAPELFCRLVDSTMYEEQVETRDHRCCISRGVLVGLDLHREECSPEVVALADQIHLG